MAIQHVLAVVAVSDVDRSVEWYRTLFDTPPTNVPMPGSLAEWRLTDSGWVQVFQDAERAGRSFANVAVDELDHHVEALRERGIEAGEVVDADKGVRLCSVQDPDGNTITFIGNFRTTY